MLNTKGADEMGYLTMSEDFTQQENDDVEALVAKRRGTDPDIHPFYSEDSSKVSQSTRIATYKYR